MQNANGKISARNVTLGGLHSQASPPVYTQYLAHVEQTYGKREANALVRSISVQFERTSVYGHIETQPCIPKQNTKAASDRHGPYVETAQRVWHCTDRRHTNIPTGRKTGPTNTEDPSRDLPNQLLSSKGRPRSRLLLLSLSLPSSPVSHWPSV